MSSGLSAASSSQSKRCQAEKAYVPDKQTLSRYSGTKCLNCRHQSAGSEVHPAVLSGKKFAQKKLKILKVENFTISVLPGSNQRFVVG
jgi:hypothetical protein